MSFCVKYLKNIGCAIFFCLENGLYVLRLQNVFKSTCILVVMQNRNHRYRNPDVLLLNHVFENPVRYIGAHTPISDPVSAAEMSEAIERLAKDCSKLPDKVNQVIALRYGPAGFTQVETARVLEISRHDVQRFERQGLARLGEDTVLRHAYGAA